MRKRSACDKEGDPERCGGSDSEGDEEEERLKLVLDASGSDTDAPPTGRSKKASGVEARNNDELNQQLKDLSSGEDEACGGDDDDDAPDDVTFVAGRQAALARLQEARERSEREHANKKKLRLERELRNKERKKQKLDKKATSFACDNNEVRSNDDNDGDVCRLTQDDVDSLGRRQHIEQFSDDDDNKNVVRKEDSRDDEEEDFIPLESSGIRPVRVREILKLSSSTQMRTAQQFKDSRLFRARISRETMSQKLAANDKKRARRIRV